MNYTNTQNLSLIHLIADIYALLVCLVVLIPLIVNYLFVGLWQLCIYKKHDLLNEPTYGLKFKSIANSCRAFHGLIDVKLSK